MDGISNIKFSALIFLSFITISCNNQKKTYYEDGNLKSTISYNNEGKEHGVSLEYFPNGKIKEEKNFENGFLKDSVSKYDENGKLTMSITITNDSLINYLKVFDSNKKIKSEGYIKNGEKIRTWKYYDSTELIAEEQFFGKNEFKLNQRKIFKSEIVDNKKSFYYQLSVPDTVYQNTVFLVKADYSFIDNNLEYGENNFVYFCISNKINKDFSNLNEVRIDTFIPSTKGVVEAKLLMKKSGNYFLRGTIEEHNLIEKSDKMDIEISKMYFEKKIVVKKTSNGEKRNQS